MSSIDISIHASHEVSIGALDDTSRAQLQALALDVWSERTGPGPSALSACAAWHKENESASGASIASPLPAMRTPSLPGYR